MRRTSINKKNKKVVSSTSEILKRKECEDAILHPKIRAKRSKIYTEEGISVGSKKFIFVILTC